ncbi:MAG: YraN family protein [Armatimonadetes bacterium]|nr:YraN family protein [Armatimonadota bacterium]
MARRAARLVDTLAGLLQTLRRKVVPWDPEWQSRRGEKHIQLPRSSDRARRAREAEEAIARHLWLSGYRIIARNVRNRYGELDIVAEKDGRLHFVEVRSYVESSLRPSGLLTAEKRRSLFLAAHLFRRRRPELAGLGMTIQVAEVCFSRDGRRRSIQLVALDYTRRH